MSEGAGGVPTHQGARTSRRLMWLFMVSQRHTDSQNVTNHRSYFGLAKKTMRCRRESSARRTFILGTSRKPMNLLITATTRKGYRRTDEQPMAD